MKIVYCIIVLLICCSCNNSSNDRGRLGDDASKKQAIINNLNDSALSLMFQFQERGDTAKIEKALLLNDKMLEIDVNNEFENTTLFLRAQILYCMGRYKENFEMRSRFISDDKEDIDRIIYMGVKLKMSDQNDSADYYLNLALDRCNSVLKDTLDIPYVIRSVEVNIAMGRENEARRILNDLTLKYPEDYELAEISNQFDETVKVVSSIITNDNP